MFAWTQDEYIHSSPHTLVHVLRDIHFDVGLLHSPWETPAGLPSNRSGALPTVTDLSSASRKRIQRSSRMPTISER